MSRFIPPVFVFEALQKTKKGEETGNNSHSGELLVKYKERQIKKLRSIVKKTKINYDELQQDLRIARRYDIYEFENINEKNLDKQQELLEVDNNLDDCIKALQEKLDNVQEVLDRKQIVRKNVRRDVNYLKEKQKDTFDTCRIAVLDIVEATTNNQNLKKVSRWKRFKSFIGLKIKTSLSEQRKMKRNTRMKEMLGNVWNDLHDAVECIDDFDVGENETYSISI